MKLGRVQSKYDARTLKLGDYVSVEHMPVPPARELVETTTTWPMLANDQFNCCTSAAAGHMIHHWTAANKDGIFLTDQDIIRAHAQLTGDRLMDCVSMLEALKYWRNTGIGAHRIHSFVQAHHGQADQLRCIVHLFGSAYIGLDLPRFACAGISTGWPAIEWAVPVQVATEDAVALPDMGHCVMAVGYGPDGVYVVTWGALKTMSWSFFEAYNVETYAVLSNDWVRDAQASPTGFPFSKLHRDLHAVAQPRAV
jgi:hypothetical protein